MVSRIAYYLTGAAMAAFCATGASAQNLASPSSAQITTGQSTDGAAADNNQGIGDIVVTATRTGETKVQNTPLAISVFSAEKLNSSLVTNVKDLVALTPNLNVAQVTASAAIYIRGIGSNNVFAGSDPDVTVQSDGVYIARAFGQFTDFVDVQRVEVLRGPQGTLYGRNAIGGTINIISRLPKDIFEAKAQLTGGTYGLFQGQAFVSGPIIPGVLQASITGNYIRHDSYIDNILSGAHDVNNANRGGVRGQLRFEPADGIETITRADFNASHEYLDGYDHILLPIPAAPLATSIVGDYTKVAIDNPQTVRTRFWGVAEEVNIELGRGLSLKSLTAFRFSQYYGLQNDTDATELVAIAGNQGEKSRQFSQEFDLTAHFHHFDGVMGVFYFRDHVSSLLQSISRISPFTPPARAALSEISPESYTQSKAVFAQGVYHLTDQLGLTVGVRYTEDRKTIDQNFSRVSLNPATPNLVFPGLPFIASQTRKYNAITPKFGIDYQFTPVILAYASATRGYKSGGTNYAASTLAALSFNPETIWSYEAGFKSEFLDHRVRLNISAFKYDYKDLQVSALIGPTIVAISNAATAKVKGLEFEATAKPVPALTLSANLSFLDARYGRFPSAAVPNQLVPFVVGNPNYSAALGTYDASGNRLNAAPGSSYFLSAQYDREIGPGRAFVRGEFYRQSKVYYDPTNAEIMSQRGYHLVNASIGYNDPVSKWGLQIVGKNVTNTRYLITIAANGVVPSGLAGAPRTVAIQLSKSW